MQLNIALARQVAEKSRSILKRDIIITDTSGQIMVGGATQTSARSFVAEALNVAQTGHTITTSYADRQTKWWPFVYEGQTAAVFGLPIDVDPITQEAINLLHGLAEVLLYQFFLFDKLQSSERIRADFLSQLLTSGAIVADDIYHQADILQLDVRSPQAIILIQFDGLEAAIKHQHRSFSSEEQQIKLDEETTKVSEVIREFYHHHQDNLVAYIGDNRFILFKGIGGDHLTTLNTIKFMTDKGENIYKMLQKLQLKQTITVGIGQYYPNLGGLRKSYQDAKLSLEVGKKVWGSNNFYHIKRVGMFITLANTSQDRKAELAYQILSPLLRDEQLYKTVQSFLANGLNLTEAATKLHIHRNTLIYRLDKTKKLIQLDPRHFDDALQIKLGLMFYQDTPA
jgi:carbohydrate diacid regulator